MDTINQPYGGTLINLFVNEEKATAYKMDTEMPSWDLLPQQLNDVELLIHGAYSPLTGFLNQKDLQSVSTRQQLTDGTYWPEPIALQVSDAHKTGTKLGLRDAEGVLIAVLTIEECWKADCGRWHLSGPLEGTESPLYYDFTELRCHPKEIRKYLKSLPDPQSVVHLTDQPLHRDEVDSINEGVAKTSGSFTLVTLAGGSELRNLDHFSNVRCHQSALKETNSSSQRLMVLPTPSGSSPENREALCAIVAQNCGFSHLISTCTSTPKDLEISALPLIKAEFAWKDTLETGGDFPKNFTFPEVEKELRQTYPPRSEKGLTLFFTGFSGSGKSTIAQHVQVKLQERGERSVTLLDGDLVRKNLSSELGFSREHRNLNILRIGFVANEITKNGGIAICAPIAPFDEIRKQVRALVEESGNFVLIHVATSIEVCESRDRKGLYAKARAGLIKEFTGISDPYDDPADAELVVQTADCTPVEASDRVIDFLKSAGYLA